MKRIFEGLCLAVLMVAVMVGGPLIFFDLMKFFFGKDSWLLIPLSVTLWLLSLYGLFLANQEWSKINEKRAREEYEGKLSNMQDSYEQFIHPRAQATPAELAEQERKRVVAKKALAEMFPK